VDWRRDRTWSQRQQPRANNLKAVEEIMPISARLIVNQAALKLKREAIQPMLDAFAGAVAKSGR
jgi:ATP phosphoribosyltransferase